MSGAGYGSSQPPQSVRLSEKQLKDRLYHTSETLAEGPNRRPQLKVLRKSRKYDAQVSYAKQLCEIKLC